MRILRIFAFLMFTLILQAAQMNEKLTALYLSGSLSEVSYWQSDEIDIEDKAFFISDGDFDVQMIKGYNPHISFSFHRIDLKEDWTISFCPPKNESLKAGVYRNTRDSYFHDNAPGFSVVRNSTSYSHPGEFEILEIEYDQKGEIQVLAANFAMTDFNRRPLFGSVRFNSSVPVAKRFNQEIKKEPSAIYLSKKGPLSGDRSQPVLISEAPNSLVVKQLPFGEEGVRVFIHGQNENWALDFASPIRMPLSKGIYHSSSRYPFHGLNEAGIGVAKSRSCAAIPVGSFEVVDIQRNANGKMNFIKFNFSIETEEGEIYEGTIQYSFPFVEEESEMDCEDED